MPFLPTRGLTGNNTDLILRGLHTYIAVPVVTGPGFYRIGGGHPLLRLLRHGLEVRQLYWRQEEINPMVVIVSSEEEGKLVPIKVSVLNAEEIRTKVPICILADGDIDAKISIAEYARESVLSQVPIAVDFAEEVTNIVRVSDDHEWFILEPAAVFSPGKVFIVKSIKELKTRPFEKFDPTSFGSLEIERRELEILRR